MPHIIRAIFFFVSSNLHAQQQNEIFVGASKKDISQIGIQQWTQKKCSVVCVVKTLPSQRKFITILQSIYFGIFKRAKNW
jgi:hypothetical protein